MREVTVDEVHFVSGADAMGDAMIRVGTRVEAAGHVLNEQPGGKATVGPALVRLGTALVDSGERRNETVGGGPGGGGPNGG